LSATLDVGDVVVYQTGSWYVDGVQVGDDTTSTPTFHYGLVETIQIVWTHNCEHGVIRVWPMTCSMQQKTTMTSGDEDNSNNNTRNNNHTILQLLEMEECIEFGPEQLVAKLDNLQWDDEYEKQQAISSITLTTDMWSSGTTITPT